MPSERSLNWFTDLARFIQRESGLFELFDEVVVGTDPSEVSAVVLIGGVGRIFGCQFSPVSAIIEFIDDFLRGFLVGDEDVAHPHLLFFREQIFRDVFHELFAEQVGTENFFDLLLADSVCL